MTESNEPRRLRGSWAAVEVDPRSGEVLTVLGTYSQAAVEAFVDAHNALGARRWYGLQVSQRTHFLAPLLRREKGEG